MLAAARGEFAVRGLGGATGEGLAYRADISHPYLLRLFGSKRELFLDVLERLFGDLQRAVKSTSARPGESAGIEALRGVLTEALGEHGAALLLQALAACGDEEVRLAVQRWVGELYESLERVTSPRAGSADALLAWLFLVGARDTLQVSEIASRQPWARRLLDSVDRA